MKEVVLYSRSVPFCPHCVTAKKALEEANIKFEVRDIMESETYREEHAAFGLRTVPLVIVDGVNLGGADKIKQTIEIILKEDNARTVVKRDGSEEPFDASKVNNMCTWAIEHVPDVCWSSIAMKALHKLPTKGKIPVDNIQKALISSCLEEETPAHNKVAGRLLLGSIRKESIADEDFLSFYHGMVELGQWKDMDYTDEDLVILGDVINHNLDETYGYPTIRQFRDKYLSKDENGYLLELPQHVYMGIAMSMFEDSPLEDVIGYYHKCSQHNISLPSPILTGQRTPSNQGVSCVITTAGDSVQSIEASKHIMSVATAHSAGLGAEYAVRSQGDDVRKGYATAGGQLPHLRVADNLVKEFTQTSRGGSVTVSYNCLDPELQTLFNLKLKRTPETKRIDLIDYSLVHNNAFLKRAAKKLPWCLVSRAVAPKLWEAFYNDSEDFETIMEEVIADETIKKKKVVPTLTLLVQFLDNRMETGRMYRYNYSEGNKHTAFKEDIRLSNL